MNAYRKARLLVIGEGAAEVESLQRQLAPEFDEVHGAWHTDSLPQVFDGLQPDVLVLAYPSLVHAHQAYLGLQLASRAVQSGRHRSVLLCHKDDRDEVFDLCERRYFDDYVLFWPHVVDGHRLVMAILRCLWDLRLAEDQRLAGHVSSRARGVADALPALEVASQRVHGLATRAKDAFETARVTVEGALRGMEHHAAEWAPDALRREVRRIATEQIGPTFEATAEAITPLAQVAGELQVAMARQSMAVSELSRTAHGVRPRVLVVDDDAFQRELIAHVLGELGYDAEGAADGLSALAALHRHPPDVVLMDVLMPRMSGIEALRRIKATPPLDAIPVVLMSGDSASVDLEAGVLSGARDFLTKPVTRAVLQRKLGRALGRAGDGTSGGAAVP
ncbi:hypothetical protein GCM10028794_23750 [Silanimonas algicola]